MGNQRVPEELVHKALLAYAKERTVAGVANECGIAWATANRLVAEGAPQYGIRPFAVEVRQLFREQNKVLRVTEMTKQVRLRVEENDLAGMQDLLLEFEGMVHEGMVVTRKGIAVQRDYYDKLAAHEAGEIEEPPERPKGRISMFEVKALSDAMVRLFSLKAEFFDRMEIVRRTELEMQAEAGFVHEDLPELPEPDFQAWTPQEVARYTASLEAGSEPEYPEWWIEEMKLGSLIERNNTESRGKSAPADAKSDTMVGLRTPPDEISFPGDHQAPQQTTEKPNNGNDTGDLR